MNNLLDSIFVMALLYIFVAQPATADFNLVNPFDTFFLTQEEVEELQDTDYTIREWEKYKARLEDDLNAARLRINSIESSPTLESSANKLEDANVDNKIEVIKVLREPTFSNRVIGALSNVTRFLDWKLDEIEALNNLDGVNLRQAESQFDLIEENISLSSAYINAMATERAEIIGNSDRRWEEMKDRLAHAIAEQLEERRRVENERNLRVREQIPRLQDAIQQQRQREQAEREYRRTLQFKNQLRSWFEGTGPSPNFIMPDGGCLRPCDDPFDYPDATMELDESDFPNISWTEVRDRL